MSELDLLRVCKQAVDEGLIGKGDYDVVKVAFLRAQQIKAGLDAGFIRTEDYNKARDAYLNALDFNALIGAGAGSGSGPLPTGPLGGGAPAGNGSAPSGGSSALRAAVAAFENNGGPVPAPPTRGARVAGAGAGSGGATPAGSGSLSGGDGSGGGAAGARAGGGAGPRNSGAGDIAAIMADVPQYSKGATAGKFSMAGIAINEDCVNLFMHMKTRSAYKWVTFKVDDSGKTVVPDRVGGKNSAYEDFVAALPASDCRYGVYDYEYVSPERGSFSKIVFINWAPDPAHIKTKMMYAATKDFFKGFLDGTGAELQANEAGEVSEEEIRARVVTNLTRK